MSPTKVARIAAAVRSGRVNLPDLNLNHDDDYYEVWALVDTGAGANVARMKQHLPTATKSKRKGTIVRLKTASGECLPYQGQFRVNALTDEGHATQVDFVDADVDMPILSGAMICEGGADGSDLSFNKMGGNIVDVRSGRNSQFIKRQGVYFIRLNVPKERTDVESDDGAGNGFVRPGQPRHLPMSFKPGCFR